MGQSDREMKALCVGAKLLGLAFVTVAALAIGTSVNHPWGADFLSFWAASVLTLQGNSAAAYDIVAHHAVQSQVASFKGLLPFFNPPPFLLFVLPLGLLPYWAAAATWIAGTFALYCAVARRLFPEGGWMLAAYPAVVVNAILGQNGFLTAALFLAGLLALPKRPLTAGLLLGCLIIKPQLGLLLPIAFLAARDWRAMAGAACAVAGMLGIALLAFGLPSYAAWLQQTAVSGSVLIDGSVSWHKLASVYASLRLAGVPSPLSWAGHILVALAAAAAVWLVWRRQVDWGARAAALAAGTVLASPYLYLYDTLILVVPFLWLLREGGRPSLLALLWCLPLLGVAQNWVLRGPINLTPLVSVAVLALVCRRALASDRGNPAGEQASIRIMPPAQGLGGSDPPRPALRARVL